MSQAYYDSHDAWKIRGKSISTTSPTNGQTLVYNSTTRQWVPGSGGGTTYTAGSGITLPGNAITADTAVMATRANAQSGADNTCTDAGGDDTYTCTLAYALPSYTTGMCLNLIVSTTNTGAATVDAGPGAKNIVTAANATLTDGDIIVGAANRICYDGTSFRMGGGGTSVAAAPPYLTIGGTKYLPMGFAATMPPTTGWTAENCGACTFTTSGLNGALSLIGTGISQLQVQRRALGTNRTLIVAASMDGRVDSGTVNYCMIGIKGSNNGRFQGTGPGSVNSNSIYSTFSGWSSVSANISDEAMAPVMGGYALYKFVAGTDLTISGSSNGGISWTPLKSFTYSAVFGATVSASDEWFVAAKTNGSDGIACHILSWQES